MKRLLEALVEVLELHSQKFREAIDNTHMEWYARGLEDGREFYGKDTDGNPGRQD